MKPGQTMMLAMGIGTPTATAEADVNVSASSSADDCVVINENGTVYTDIPCLQRFVQNITEP